MECVDSMTAPLIDVIVPLHRTDRAIDDAVASAQSSVQGIATRVLVVLHNLDVDEAERVRLGASARVLLCDDGVASPSGPRNIGLDAASAPFVFFLDSDDRLAPDCLRRLHDAAEATGADVVLPSLWVGHRYVGTPLVWSRRCRVLDVVNHDLFMRSHVPALLRRQVLDSSGVRYPDGIRTAEDLVVMAHLYAIATTSVALDAVYIVLDDAVGRTSTAPLRPDEQLAAMRLVLDSPWVDRLDVQERDLLVRRILSVNIAGAWRTLAEPVRSRAQAEHVAVRDLALARSPGARALLSVRDLVSLRFDSHPGRVARVLLRRPFGLVPVSLKGAISPHAPMVREARSSLVRHRPRRVDRSILDRPGT